MLDVLSNIETDLLMRVANSLFAVAPEETELIESGRDGGWLPLLETIGAVWRGGDVNQQTCRRHTT